MGKQAKKKDKNDAQAAKQKRHNVKTKGMNTSKRGAVWATRSYKARDEEGNEVTRKYNVYVPARTLWDPWDPNRNDERKVKEPFDALHLDWRKEVMEFAADNNARIGKISIGNGKFLYRVFLGDSVEKPSKVFFEIESSRKFVDVRDKKRRRRPKKVG